MSLNIVDQTTGALTQAAGSVVTAVYSDAPVGAIVPFGGSTFPTGWLLCDGTELLRADYPDLFAVIGTSFGTPSADTKFKLPDLRESVPVGAGQNATQTIATHDTYTVGEFKDDQFQSHVHNTRLKGHMTASSGDAWCTSYDQEITGTRTTSASTDTGFTPREGTTTHGKQMGVNYIIKAFKTALPTDFTEEIDDVKDEIDDILNVYGSKNLLNLTLAELKQINTTGTWNDNVYSENGLTFTFNSNSSVTINGTASGTEFFRLTGNELPFTADIQLLNEQSEAEADGYILSSGVARTNWSFGYTLVNTTTWFYYVSGETYNNVTIYPMLRLASIEDDTYVPYAMTNKELTDELSDTSSKADSAYSTAALSAYIAEGNSSLDVEILPWAIYFMTVGASGGGGSRFLTAAYYMVAVADNPTHAVVASKIGGSDAMEFTGTFTYKSNNIYTVTNPSGRRIQFWKLGLVTQ